MEKQIKSLTKQKIGRHTSIMSIYLKSAWQLENKQQNNTFLVLKQGLSQYKDHLSQV